MRVLHVNDRYVPKRTVSGTIDFQCEINIARSEGIW